MAGSAEAINSEFKKFVEAENEKHWTLLKDFVVNLQETRWYFKASEEHNFTRDQLKSKYGQSLGASRIALKAGADKIAGRERVSKIRDLSRLAFWARARVRIEAQEDHLDYQLKILTSMATD